MVAIVEPDEEERYLLAILDSPDGIDLGEFAVHDPRNDDGCYRLYDFQWAWWSCRDTYQIDQGARSCGKTEGIKLRALAFPFYRAGAGMLISAPELNHLRPLTDEIEKMLLNTRIVREMLPAVKSAGIARQPHWQVRFKNGSSIISRLPNKDGRGVKGCIAATVRVLTRRGHVPIEEVQVGDEVLTHMGRWRPVTRTYSYPGGEGLQVKGSGHRGLVVSDMHAFYGRRNSNPQRTRNLSTPMWVDAVSSELQRWYWATPTTVPSDPIALPGDFDGSVVALMALAGAYVADGHREADGKRICLTDAWGDVPRLEALAKDAGYSVTTHPHADHGESTARVSVYSPSLTGWLVEHFGRLANGKRLPAWLLGATEELRRAFWDAYCAGDGHWVESRRRWEVSTASRTLAADLKMLATSLGYDAGFSWLDPKVTHIAGVELKAAPQRSYRVHAVESGHKIAEYGHAWGKIGSVTSVEVSSFHDLSVEEDNSYVAEGIVQHNQHVDELHIDEAQDFNAYGWREIVETLNTGAPDAMWRCHGVSRGVRDAFYDKSQPGSGWTVHRPMAMNRPSWSKEERDAKIVEYGGSRQSVDYRRNIYGEHGDASNAVFVLAKLMAIVDLDEGSTYNTDVYAAIKMHYERFPKGAGDDERAAMIDGWMQIPSEHFRGYSQKVGNKEVGSPKGYTAYWGGMDVGVTNHPSEILIFGQRAGSDFLELLLRVHMQRINTDDQMLVVSRLFEIYGKNLQLGIDKMQPVSEPVLTPKGWVPIGKLAVGDRVIGSDGHPTEVTGVYPQQDRRVTRLICSDGSSARSGPEHLWTVEDRLLRVPLTVTTEQLAALISGQKQRRYAIALVGPADLLTRDLPVDSYVLGHLLGNGNLRTDSIRYSHGDSEAVDLLRAALGDDYDVAETSEANYVVRHGRRRDHVTGRMMADDGLLAALRKLGLAGLKSHEKFVPSDYLVGSIAQRHALLQGLMDTDGHVTVSPNGRSVTVGFTSTSLNLCRAVVELTQSLGGMARLQTMKRGKSQTLVDDGTYHPAWRVTLALPKQFNPFRLPRKADAVVPQRPERFRRYVDRIEWEEPEESVCIRVAADDHLYVTCDYLLTHNTGVGFMLWDQLTRRPFGARIHGFGFSEKRVVAIEDRELTMGETNKDLAKMRNVVEASTDWLRNDYVDAGRMRLPYDREVLIEWQGQTYITTRDTGDPYGVRRQYSGGSFHTLDAAKVAIATINIPVMEEMLEAQPAQGPVFDAFMGA